MRFPSDVFDLCLQTGSGANALTEEGRIWQVSTPFPALIWQESGWKILVSFGPECCFHLPVDFSPVSRNRWIRPFSSRTSSTWVEMHRS
jgi:hypothetical protein